MKKILFLFFISTFFFLKTNLLYANNNTAFIDLDLVLKKTIIGKLLLNDLEVINNKNIEELKNKEKELKNDEEEIKKKQNVISQEQFDLEVKNLQDKVSKYRVLKNEMVKSLDEKKKEKLSDFFKKINPIIQNYMDANSVDILLERKNVFIGKNKSDITDIIVKEIDKKFKN